MASKRVNTPVLSIYYSASLYNSPNFHQPIYAQERIFHCVPPIMHVSGFTGMSAAMSIYI
jgi:hypothetical protein